MSRSYISSPPNASTVCSGTVVAFKYIGLVVKAQKICGYPVKSLSLSRFYSLVGEAKIKHILHCALDCILSYIVP
jgi:hypothetical protein